MQTGTVQSSCRVRATVYIDRYFPFLFRSSIKSSNHQSSSSSSSSSLSSCSSSSALAQELSQQASVLPEAEASSQVDWTYDPNEPRYCICNQVASHSL